MIIERQQYPDEKQAAQDIDNLLPPGRMEIRIAGGTIDLQNAHRADEEHNDEDGPIDVARREVAKHG